MYKYKKLEFLLNLKVLDKLAELKRKLLNILFNL